MKVIKLSVIIPCFNQQQFIRSTLGSVARQSFPDWECLVIDDGSTDKSRNVIEEFVQSDSRFKYYFQENAGVSNARNYGLSLAKGDYIHFLDADDIVYELMFEKFINLLEENPQYDLVYGVYDYVDEHGEIVNLQTLPLVVNENPITYFTVKNIFPVFAAIFRNKQGVEGYEFDANLSYGEDWDFWLRLALKHYMFYGINFKTGAYRRHNLNVSNDQLKMLQGSEQILKKNSPALKSVLGRRFDLERSLYAMHIAAYARAVNNGDRLSLDYLEGKVAGANCDHLFKLCLSPVTLPAVLNFAAIKKTSLLYYLFFIPNLLRSIVRKICL